jgi:hypothetical protein
MCVIGEIIGFDVVIYVFRVSRESETNRRHLLKRGEIGESVHHRKSH